jgi:hypothetical protein
MKPIIILKSIIKMDKREIGSNIGVTLNLKSFLKVLRSSILWGVLSD